MRFAVNWQWPASVIKVCLINGLLKWTFNYSIKYLNRFRNAGLPLFYAPIHFKFSWKYIVTILPKNSLYWTVFPQLVTNVSLCLCLDYVLGHSSYFWWIYSSFLSIVFGVIQSRCCLACCYLPIKAPLQHQNAINTIKKDFIIHYWPCNGSLSIWTTSIVWIKSPDHPSEHFQFCSHTFTELCAVVENNIHSSAT